MLLEEDMDLVVVVEEELNQLIMVETVEMVQELQETQMQVKMGVTEVMVCMEINQQMVLAVIVLSILVMQELADALTSLGIPVPPGFTITTEVGKRYRQDSAWPEGLAEAVAGAIGSIEARLGGEVRYSMTSASIPRSRRISSAPRDFEQPGL